MAGLRIRRRDSQRVNFYHAGRFVGTIKCEIQMVESGYKCYRPEVDLVLDVEKGITIVREEADKACKRLE